MNEYMTCRRGPKPMATFSQSHLVKWPGTCSIPYTILLLYQKGHLSLDFEKFLESGLIEGLISQFWLVTRATPALNLLKAHVVGYLTPRSLLVATYVCKLHTRVKTLLHYVANRRSLARDGAVTDLS